MVVAFTGHRPNKLGGYKPHNSTQDRIIGELELELLMLAPTSAISGMALGVDQWAAKICVQFKIPFIAAVPFVGQERMWPEHSIAGYDALLAKASEVVIVSEGEYSAAKMQIRNQWMVDRCDVLLAVWDGTSGGTGNCVKYAQKMKKQIVRIKP